MIGEGLYECGSCGHRWNPGEGLSDLTDVVCEMCHELDVFVQQVRKGYARGLAHSTARWQQEQATQRAIAARPESWFSAVLRWREEEAEAWRLHYERKEAEVRAADQQWEAEQHAAKQRGRATSDG